MKRGLWIETVPSLDIALGGGIREGNVVSVVGPEGCGKTCLCSYIAQHTENSLYLNSEPWNLNVEKPGRCLDIFTLQEAVEALADAHRECLDLVVIDSVAALCDGEEDDERERTQQIRSILFNMRAVVETGAAVMFTNQLRDCVNRRGRRTSGSYHRTIHDLVDVEIEFVQESKKILARSKRMTEHRVTDLLFRDGEIDAIGDLMRVGKMLGVLNGYGGTSLKMMGISELFYEPERLREALARNPELAETLWERIVLTMDEQLWRVKFSAWSYDLGLTIDDDMV